MLDQHVTVRIPDGLGYQLVYRQERSEPIDVEDRSDLSFVLIENPLGALPHLRALGQAWRPAELAKSLLRLCTGKRKLRLTFKAGRIAHVGWCWISVCKPYPIARGDVVLGAELTVEEFRGQGIGTYAVKRAINAMIARGHRTFYIDTAHDNLAAQRLFEKCGFGEPAALYLHPRQR